MLKHQFRGVYFLLSPFGLYRHRPKGIWHAWLGTIKFLRIISNKVPAQSLYKYISLYNSSYVTNTGYPPKLALRA